MECTLGRFSMLVALACIASHAAQSQSTYPTKPLRLIVGFAAGGPTDIPARYIADKLGGRRTAGGGGEQAGGGRDVGDARCAGAAEDGYTLLLCTHSIDQHRGVQNPQYKLADLARSRLSQVFYGIALELGAGGGSPKLCDHAGHRRAQHGTLGPGSAQDIFARQLERLAGISMNGVPYRKGVQILQDLISVACASTSRQ
jgi:tripartite-type tricarboxylate transporter receptor subunit TctC